MKFRNVRLLVKDYRKYGIYYAALTNKQNYEK